jgi:CheY-like chemotaxis protein
MLVSSLESSKLTLDTAEFLLRDVIQGAIDDFSCLHRESQIKISCLWDGFLPEKVIGDAARLKRLLASLFAAALERAHLPQLQLSIVSSRDRQPDLELVFELTSPPAGDAQTAAPEMAAAELPTELKRQVQLMNGDIGLHVQPGVGPVFWCRIPVQQSLQRSPAGNSESIRARTSSPAKPAVSGKKPIKILMAEDNSINQRVGKLILQRAGYEIDLVSDGSEALEAYRNKPYNLILMDCQMPTMDGFEATRQIRSLPGARQPIIIAVTANALVGERERCLAAGMDDYLSKPFQAEQLVAIVERWADAALQR